jgi:membrane protease YdiL (CAAX protease family)
MVGWAVTVGKVTPLALLVMAVHSLVSNGFCEEFMCRGLLLPTLRASAPTAWAVVAQGLLFGLVHLGGAVPEESGDPVLAAAAAVALNFPMGVALGVVAVRTGSLALPVAVHVSLHLMKDVLA